MRIFVSIQMMEEVGSFREKLLHWANNFSTCCILDSNSSSEFSGNNFSCMAGIDSADEITPSENSFEALKKFHKEKKDWLFGFMSYDLKNEIENLSSENPDEVRFPPMHFFQPKYVFMVRGNKIDIGFLPEYSSEKEVERIMNEIKNMPCTLSRVLGIPCTLYLKSRISQEEYLNTVFRIKQHIHRGDIYEMNYCMEFFAEEAKINPAEVFLKLNEASQTPFSAFYRMNDHYLMCASPERFLKKSGGKIISQPIKGTARRGKNGSEDIEIKNLLSQNEKEKSENVMIVDLVRNDLSRTCNKVSVDELCGVYTFRQWHQMISTVSGEMRKEVHFAEALKNSFPMGSMTGAPKVRAMELIERYEKTKRGLYSGAIGYVTPEGDFDFNVVIRSILYNQSSKYLSFHVGSAITFHSVPEDEYAECLLKAKGMFEALGTKTKKSQSEITNHKQ